MPRLKQAKREESSQHVYMELKSCKWLSQNTADVKSLQGKLGEFVEDKPLGLLNTQKSYQEVSDLQMAESLQEG